MSKTFYIVSAAAMFASLAAFAQTPSDKPASMPNSTVSSDEKTMHHHHHRHHGMWSAKNGNTDFDADKLNACMSNATPTEQQESCLRHASRS